MPTVPPDFKPFAFKEWQVICDALENGEQSIILRKGGISEGKHGFQWLHERFFLFPTFFHEQSNQVQPDAEGNLRSFRPQRKGGEEIEIRLFAETIETTHLTDWDEIAALAPRHLWTEQVIRERYEWGDEERGSALPGSESGACLNRGFSETEKDLAVAAPGSVYQRMSTLISRARWRRRKL